MNIPALISIRKVTKRYPGVVALDAVSLDIREGECHSIVGENGAGKSTLMKILSGVITDYEGELELRGENVRFSGTRAAEEAGISIIHQELNLVEELSAAANIFLGREKVRGPGLLDDAAMEKAAGELLESLECNVDPRERAGALRVGDQQLIEIAKALSLDTGILIMDEPTSALTESEVARLYRVIERLLARGRDRATAERGRGDRGVVDDAVDDHVARLVVDLDGVGGDLRDVPRELSVARQVLVAAVDTGVVQDAHGTSLSETVAGREPRMPSSALWRCTCVA